MGKSQRTKGHGFEREISSRLRVVFPNARRHLEYQDAEANGVDIANTSVFKFQCKKLKKYSSITAIEEVQCDRDSEIPVLVTAGDFKEPIAALYFEDFLMLIDFFIKRS